MAKDPARCSGQRTRQSAEIESTPALCRSASARNRSAFALGEQEFPDLPRIRPHLTWVHCTPRAGAGPRKIRPRSRRGYVLLTIAFFLMIFVGFLGLAIDLGYLFYVRRQMQKATDAAAIGGDHEIELVQPSQVSQAGQDDASLNGFANGQNGVIVTINNPPQSGSYQNNAAAVEAIIFQPVPALFMKAFGISTVGVRTRAVAFLGTWQNCIFGLDPNASGTIQVNGAQVSSQCGVIADSTSNSALQLSGNKATLTATTITVTGNWGGTGTLSCTLSSTCPAIGQPPAPDPLGYLTPPSYSNTCTYTNTLIQTQGTVNLSPGVYCGGIVVAGQATVNFSPGVYVLAGGQSCSVCSPTGTYGFYAAGGSSLNGTGATLYNTGPFGFPSSCAKIYIAGGTNVNLVAPTGGGNYGQLDTGGVLFFQDRSCSTQAVVAGNNGSGYTGALYFAAANLNYSGTSQGAAYSIVVADTVTLQGTPNFNDSYSTLSSGSPIKRVILGE